MIAKCPCDHCGKNIEFATEEFLSGSSVACPHCGNETFLSVSPKPKTSASSLPKLPTPKPSAPARSKIPSVFIPNFEWSWFARHKGWSIAIGFCISLFTLSGFLEYHVDGNSVFISLIVGFGTAVFATALLAFAIFIYFFPTFVAKQRQKKNHEAIFVSNLLTGWTFVGWVI